MKKKKKHNERNWKSRRRVQVVGIVPEKNDRSTVKRWWFESITGTIFVNIQFRATLWCAVDSKGWKEIPGRGTQGTAGTPPGQVLKKRVGISLRMKFLEGLTRTSRPGADRSLYRKINTAAQDKEVMKEWPDTRRSPRVASSESIGNRSNWFSPIRCIDFILFEAFYWLFVCFSIIYYGRVVCLLFYPKIQSQNLRFQIGIDPIVRYRRLIAINIYRFLMVERRKLPAFLTHNNTWVYLSYRKAVYWFCHAWSVKNLYENFVYNTIYRVFRHVDCYSFCYWKYRNISNFASWFNFWLLSFCYYCSTVVFIYPRGVRTFCFVRMSESISGTDAIDTSVKETMTVFFTLMYCPLLKSHVASLHRFNVPDTYVHLSQVESFQFTCFVFFFFKLLVTYLQVVRF